MIVSCPACSRRYKISESKIQGRGAKITCPRCAHRFVVYVEDGELVPARTDRSVPEGQRAPQNIATLDFSTLGLTWQVRKGSGATDYRFHELQTLMDYLSSGEVTRWDQLSFDGRDWTEIGSINVLETFFWNVWRRARRGGLPRADLAPPVEEPEDASDLPTTIVGREETREIRSAVTDDAPPPNVLHPPDDPQPEGTQPEHLYAFGFADEFSTAPQEDLFGERFTPSPDAIDEPPTRDPTPVPLAATASWAPSDPVARFTAEVSVLEDDGGEELGPADASEDQGVRAQATMSLQDRSFDGSRPGDTYDLLAQPAAETPRVDRGTEPRPLSDEPGPELADAEPRPELADAEPRPLGAEPSLTGYTPVPMPVPPATQGPPLLLFGVVAGAGVLIGLLGMTLLILWILPPRLGPPPPQAPGFDLPEVLVLPASADPAAAPAAAPPAASAPPADPAAAPAAAPPAASAPPADPAAAAPPPAAPAPPVADEGGPPQDATSPDPPVASPGGLDALEIDDEVAPPAPSEEVDAMLGLPEDLMSEPRSAPVPTEAPEPAPDPEHATPGSGG